MQQYHDDPDNFWDVHFGNIKSTPEDRKASDERFRSEILKRALKLRIVEPGICNGICKLREIILNL